MNCLGHPSGAQGGARLKIFDAKAEKNCNGDKDNHSCAPCALSGYLAAFRS